MPLFLAPEKDNDPAPCRGARRLLAIALGASLLMLLSLAVDWRLDASRRDASAGGWMRVLPLSAPALWTAGSPRRHPETMHPGVDLRFAVGLESAP